MSPAREVENRLGVVRVKHDLVVTSWRLLHHETRRGVFMVKESLSASTYVYRPYDDSH